MDYWNTFLTPEMISAGIEASDISADRGAFFIFEGTDRKAFNSMDAGNYLWGAGMQTLGHSLSTAKNAAHGHHFLFGRTRHRQGGLLDSPADQRAIKSGYNNASRINSEEESK